MIMNDPSSRSDVDIGGKRIERRALVHNVSVKCEHENNMTSTDLRHTDICHVVIQLERKRRESRGGRRKWYQFVSLCRSHLMNEIKLVIDVWRTSLL
jgi:hypothetical protein